MAWFSLFQQNIIWGYIPIPPQNLLIVLRLTDSSSWIRIILAVSGMIHFGPASQICHVILFVCSASAHLCYPVMAAGFTLCIYSFLFTLTPPDTGSCFHI